MRIVIYFLLTWFPFLLSAQFNLCDNPEITLVTDADTAYQVKEVSQSIVEIDGIIFYSFDDGVHGNELWTSDGTSRGTYMVMDIYPGKVSSNPANLTILNGTLVFSALSPDYGYELWQFSYGLLGAFPNLKEDILQGPNSSDPQDFHVSYGKGGVESLMFSAYQHETGREPWIMHGANSAVTMIKDINPGVASSNPSNFCNLETNVALFSADDGTHGVELHKTSGTTGSTTMIKDINDGLRDSAPSHLTFYNDAIYFAAKSKISGNSQSHIELWKSDGTAVGTMLFKDINENVTYNIGLNSGSPYAFQIYDEELYFIASPSASDFLYKTDGDSTSTSIVEGAFPYVRGSLCVVGDLLYYSNNNGNNLSAFNSSDAQSTTIAQNVYPTDLTAHNGSLYFRGRTSSTDPGILYSSAGTSSTTGPVHDSQGSGTTYPQHLTSAEDFFFFAHTRDEGYELYHYSELEGSINIVEDASSNVYNASSSIPQVLSIGDEVYAVQSSVNSVRQIYRIEDYSLTSIAFGNEGISINQLFIGNVDTTIFAHRKNSAELFKLSKDNDEFEEFYNFNHSDGGISASFSIPNFLILFFYNYDTDQYEIWSLDTSDVVTHIGTMDYLVNTIENGDFAIYVNGWLYFVEDDKDNKHHLWKTDGTSDNTERLDFIPLGSERPHTFKRLRDGVTLFSSNRDIIYYTEGSIGTTDSIDSSDFPPEFTSLDERDMRIVNEDVFIHKSPHGLYRVNDNFDGLELAYSYSSSNHSNWASTHKELILSHEDSIYIWADNEIKSFFRPESFDNKKTFPTWDQLVVANYDPSPNKYKFKPEVNILKSPVIGFERNDYLSELFSQRVASRFYKVIGDQIFVMIDDGKIGVELWKISCRCADLQTINSKNIEHGLYRSATELEINGATIPNELTIFDSQITININEGFEVRNSSVTEFRIQNECK